MDPNDPLATYIPWDPERSDVQTTESGLQYVIVREGEEGGVTPGPRDRVSVMYDGRLTDGTVFDSSYERGSTATFGVGQVISGWTEGLQLMSVPAMSLSSTSRQSLVTVKTRDPGGKIKPGDDLIFRVELKQVVKAPEPRAN